MWILLMLAEEAASGYLIKQLAIYGYTDLLKNKLLIIIFNTYFDSSLFFQS